MNGWVEIECRDAPGQIPQFLVWLVSPDDMRILFHDGGDYAEAQTIAETAATRFGPVHDLFQEARTVSGVTLRRKGARSGVT